LPKISDIGVEAARLLAHVALMAAWEGHNAVSEQIFSALQAAEPREINVRLCRAIVLACQQRYEPCVELLQEVLQRSPGDITARGLLAFACYSLQSPGWRELAEQVLEDGTDPTMTALAGDLLRQECHAT
jgi:cytochrome c-type biogenesis protein CcmH/NrfG